MLVHTRKYEHYILYTDKFTHTCVNINTRLECKYHCINNLHKCKSEYVDFVNRY